MQGRDKSGVQHNEIVHALYNADACEVTRPRGRNELLVAAQDLALASGQASDQVVGERSRYLCRYM